MIMKKKCLCGLDADEILRIIEPGGFKFSHAVSIANSIYKKGITDFSKIAGVPKQLKEELSENYYSGVCKPVASQVSSDGTIKYLFSSEKSRKFEAVYLHDNKRYTVCVSTQSGCRMGCPFCVTGRYGFYGNLSAGEIVNQVISLPGAKKVTHVVFMGMGEPMDNLENVLKACKILTAEWGLAISSRNITVSSVGITPGIIEFLEVSDCNLTVSLHSPFPEERAIVVPVERKYPVQEIIEIMKIYPLRKKRRLSLAYVMIGNLNDTDRHLNGLRALLEGTQIRINLLPYHPLSVDSNTSSSVERMQYFKHNLVISGISASIRRSRGVDISAACGLLASGLK